MATARGGHAVRARPPGTRRGSSRARCQSAGRQARTCTQARGVLRRITRATERCQASFRRSGALANGATNGLERGAWRVGLRQQADAAPAARAVGDALEEAEVAQQHLAEEARVHLDGQSAQVVALLLVAVCVNEDDARALEELWGPLFPHRCRTPPARSMLEEPPREPPVVDFRPLPPR